MHTSLHNFLRYAELMKTLMTNDCRYLLETLDYDEAKFEGTK